VSPTIVQRYLDLEKYCSDADGQFPIWARPVVRDPSERSACLMTNDAPDISEQSIDFYLYGQGEYEIWYEFDIKYYVFNSSFMSILIANYNLISFIDYSELELKSIIEGSAIIESKEILLLSGSSSFNHGNC
jgi:hypothetical protein